MAANLALARLQSIYRSLRPVLAPFVATRVAIAFLFVLTALVRLDIKPREEGGPFFSLKRPLPSVMATISATIQRGDSFRYAIVAREGYSDPDLKVSPPGYPILLRIAATISGEYWITACILNSALTLAGLWALYWTGVSLGFREDDARRAVILCCVFPTTHFLSTPFAEATLFASSSLSIYFAATRRWWASCGWGILASVGKVAGPLIFIPLALLYIREHGLRIKKALIPVLLSPSGMVAYLIYLRLFGGFDLAKQQRDYSMHGMGKFWYPVVEYLRHPTIFHSWNLWVMHFGALVLSCVAAYVLFRMGQHALGAYMLATLLFPLTAQETLGAYTRYMTPCASLYLALGVIGRSKAWYEGFYAVFLLLAAFLTTLFPLGFGISAM